MFMAHVHLFTADANFVDCQLVRTRKAEFNFFSPAELMQFVGPAVLDESSAHIPLKALLTSHSTVRVSMVENHHDASKIPSEKPSRRLGGRPRLAVEDQSFYKIGRSVEQEFLRCERGFELRRKLTNGGVLDLNALRKEMKKERFSEVEIESVLIARTPMGAAEYFVARQLYSEKKPNGLSLRTVHSAHSRYLRSKLPSV